MVYMSDSVLDQVIQHPEVIYTLAQELVAEREQLEGIRKQLDAAQSKWLADASCRQICKGLFYCPGLLRQKRKTGAADKSDLQGKESSLQVV